ncbi:hypothetical protein [Demequina soli]|uniref:hypothetical protein n=1 Tax=Demequina soli TaxID=1638987 RepID=UPI0007856D5D|nr:hypothetical protein [Demequina soli]
MTEGPVEPPAAPAAPRRRRGLAIGLALALVAVVALAVPLALLATARSTWEGQNADLRGRVRSLTDQVSDQNTRLASLEQTRAELAALKKEYSSAVNSGAQGTELVTELEDIVDAYQRCVDAQQEHFDVLRHPDRYIASSVDASESSIVDYCDKVHAAYDAFQAKHG